MPNTTWTLATSVWISLDWFETAHKRLPSIIEWSNKINNIYNEIERVWSEPKLTNLYPTNPNTCYKRARRSPELPNRSYQAMSNPKWSCSDYGYLWKPTLSPDTHWKITEGTQISWRIQIEDFWSLGTHLQSLKEFEQV